MKRILSVVLSVLLLALTLAGCQKAPESAPAPTTPEGKTIVKVGAIKGPTGIGMVNLMQEDENGTTVNDYDFTVSDDPSAIASQLASGTLDIAAVPTNVAAAFYNKTNGNVQLLAVNTLGVLYMLENGNSVQSMKDLRGKTIYSMGQGANPEYILRHILTANGLDPDKDVKLVFVEQQELITKMGTGDIKIAMVPEPNVTAITNANADVRIALSVNDVWDEAEQGASRLMMGCVAVRKEFLQNNKKAVDDFLTEYRVSIEKATAEVDATATLCETYGIIPKAALAKKAIPNCKLVFVSGASMKAQIAGYYQILFDANPKSIGGKLPDDNFYYVG